MIVLQYLDRRLYDVTELFKSTRRMTLFLLPTFEREVAPLLKKQPAGGRKLYQEFVQVLFADEGRSFRRTITIAPTCGCSNT